MAPDLRRTKHLLEYDSRLYKRQRILYCFGRVLIKDIALESFVFYLILLRYVAKCMKNANKAARSKMETLGKEIVGLVGERREEAMKAYRKPCSASAEEPMYLARF